MKFTVEKQIPLAFTLALGLLIGLGLAAYFNLNSLNNSIYWEFHTQQVLQKLDENLIRIVTAESGTRGYIITGDTAYLESFNESQKTYQSNFAELHLLLYDNPKQSERLAALEKISQSRFELLKNAIAVRRNVNPENPAETLGNGEGKNLMSQIRALIEGMKSQETALLREREEAQSKSFMQAIYLSIVGSGVGFLVILLANIMITRQVGLRRRAEDALKISHKDLEIRVEKRTHELAETNQHLQMQIEKREQAENLQKIAIEAGQLGIWRLDSNSKIYTADARTLQLSGVDESEFDGSGESLFQNLHPEDAAAVKASLADSIAENSHFFSEFRVVRPDNSIKWIEATAQPEKTDQGKNFLAGFNRDITAQKELEITLEKSALHLRNVIDSLFSIVGVMTPDGILIEANRTALESASLKSEDVLNLHFADTYWWNYSPDAQKRLREAIKQAGAGKNARFDVDIRVAENRFLTIDFMLAPLFDEHGRVTHLIPSGLDLTDRLKAEESLRQSEIFNRTTLNSLSSHIAVVNKKGEIVVVNNAWDDFAKSNYPSPQTEINFVGVNYLEICGNGIQSDELTHIYDNLVKILNSETDYFSIEYPCHSPTEKRWFLLNISPLQTPEGGAVISHTNITDRVIAETEREKTLTLEKRARLEAETANRARDEFLATVSHELRNPLNAILGWSRLLQKNQVDENSFQKAIDAVVRNAESQNHLIEDLLDVSRIIAGKLRLDIAPIHPSSFVEAAIETVRPAAAAKEISFNISIEPEINKINGDVNRLQQVIWNLLSNAVKFTPKKGAVAVNVKKIDSMIEISVKDDGLGISPEFLPNVFERFRQEDASTVRKFGGLGLGLAIVRHIIEMHGGTVEAASAGENQGSTFTVKLPVSGISVNADQILSTSELSIPDENSASNINLQGLSILTVDDEADSCQLISQVLTHYGATVCTAQSAAEAFAEFQKTNFDVIISDIGMPEEDGYSLIQKIRKLPDEAGKKVAAVALTAFARPLDRVKALESGFQTHISKPVEPDELAAVIASLTHRLPVGI